ncbi:chromosome segregation protein SMC [Rurimicrobium arvi]|uniref:Chromosome partition protein Smc n=1 Tax=Rurimicrobium arvi TaxID=2049916 RepID=A0ABP8MNY8_9BACT
MQLKSLEIKGFKSFADKTHILLDHPITGIVGPNGCGKSNIVDAIRWVIGEHKIKSLRSDNLDDLVFNGSRTRAASGMAEVSLTFENTRNLLPTEFTTVTITRKFYKSGESEYRLNDVPCRLKDIHNLFLDTGVSNDSYAIIELGMVDDIIKDKDGSRRRMLEQAAGISIYKTRKKEAKQKLEGTEQDLARIEDLLFEIGNNLRTLESQARKAERYFQIKDEYKVVSIELAKASLEDFNERYKTLTEQHNTEQDRKAQIDAEVASGEAAIEGDKIKLIEREQELSRMQRQFNELQNRIVQLENEKKLASQRLEYLRERERSLNHFLGNASAQLNELAASITSADELIAQEQAGLEDAKDKLESLREMVADKREIFEEKRTVVEQLRKEMIDGQRRQFDAEKKVAIADSSVMNLQRSILHAQDEMAQRNQQISQINNEKAEAEAEQQDKQDTLAGMIERREDIKSKILETQGQMESLRSRLIDENRSLDAKKAEHDLLKSLVESLEGYPDSIKFLSKNKDWKNDAPLLSDVFVVQNEYRAALENVLDNYLNYYLVNSIEDAAQAIHLLESNKKGKANFFVLSSIAQMEESTTAAAIPGAVSALSVLNVDEPYKALARHLLGHVYIAENESSLLQTTLPKGAVLIEKSGKMLRGNYSLSGGSIGSFEGNKIGRAKNLERLAKEISTLNESTQQLRTQITETQTLITGYNQELNDKAIEQTQVELNRLSNHIISLGNRAEHLEHTNESSKKRLEDLQAQLADTQDNISDTRSELEEIITAFNDLQERITAAENEFRSVETDFNLASQQFNQHNIEYLKLQAKWDNLKQERSYKQNKSDELRGQIENNKAQLEDTSQQISEASGKLNFGDTELYDMMHKRESDEKILMEADRLFYELRNTVNQEESKLNQKRREKENAENILNSIKEKLTEMKLQLAGMKERLSVEFRVDLEEILDQPRTGEQSVEELNAEAEKMKRRLENMGEVNPTAIEAYNEMKVRHDFIVEQKTDLVNAKESLLATIEEVEQTANSKFRETFDKVRENFRVVFKALFTEEDTADLRLTDPDNVADSGIEIYAQPKGKRPSTLTQLSGGEKTLTSTAFLFAIYLIKPAPFCILDEVDAPLDDANVGKFTQMIRKFSDNSQFIIVTHNKQTMAAVDVIYGVTMQELGVSKLVPVDFRSLN